MVENGREGWTKEKEMAIRYLTGRYYLVGAKEIIKCWWDRIGLMKRELGMTSFYPQGFVKIFSPWRWG
jgi:hypothetical protein